MGVVMAVTRIGTVTGETYYRATLGRDAPADLWAWYIGPTGPLGRNAARNGLALAPSPPAPGRAVVAHLNRNRWLVACPDPACRGDYQLAFERGAFLCSRCWNVRHGGAFLAVDFPEDRAEIEAALAVAPNEARNWIPGWTPERAAAEAASARRVDLAEYRAALTWET